MTKFALRGLLGRKLRTALTAIAIVLGVTMVSGTYVLTDSIDQAFDSIFTDVRAGSNVVISGRSAFDLSDGSGASAPTFDESVLADIREVEGVQAAEGSVDSESAQLIGDDRKAIVYGGAPNLGFSIANGDSQFNPLTLVEGRWPGADEVVIDEATADKESFEVGEQVGLQAAGPVERLRIAGIVHFGAASSLGGATLAGFDLATAQRLFDKRGELDEIAVAARAGVSNEQLIGQIRPVLPPNTRVIAADQQAEEDAADTNEFITFLQGFLLAFAGIALFVGSFVIANSLSITIAQRTREFATIRTLGGSRRQVLGSIIIEALVVGTLASVVGLFLGLGLAKLLFKLFSAVGFTLPNSGLLFETRTIVVSLVVGILVTLAASLRPAIRATRVPPIAAVREGATLPESRFARFRTVGSLALTALGFGSLAYGLFADGLGTTQLLTWMGLGALLIFIGVALFAARIVRPAAAALGWPATQMGGAAGRLARDNARRNPQRTASTASALMIGLALVTLVAVLAQGITSTFTNSVEEIFTSDYAITAQNNFSPIPTAAADAAADAPGVEAVASVRTAEARIFDSNEFVTAVDPEAEAAITLEWKEGSQAVLGDLGRNGAFVDEDYAKDNDLAVGSPIPVLTPSGEKLELEVKGIFDPPTGGSPFGVVSFSSDTFDDLYESPRNLYSFIEMEGDVNEENTAALTAALTDFPNAKAQTRKQFVDNQISALSSILNILYVLLALSVIVSLFGIVNTLVLTVFERTREIGMLRAIGMTRRQVRRMIRHESVITALIGGALGIVLGIVLGGLLVARVEFIEFSLPTVQIVIFAIMTVVVGILAAIFPARRAARLDPLKALQYE
ncbi:MAG: ABC transporter permease [Actinobacteria bacterium]|nr:ABC transporter permease [Actinomycetota bacterium]MDQ3163420.1 ABC transporter permease [Actinomycetota bacterium]